ncbi:MAG: hypothetical protein ACREI3_01760, partial [Nitrospirales bacterium]
MQVPQGIRILPVSVTVGLLLTVAGCATPSDLEALRQEMTQARGSSEAAIRADVNALRQRVEQTLEQVHAQIRTTQAGLAALQKETGAALAAETQARSRIEAHATEARNTAETTVTRLDALDQKWQVERERVQQALQKVMATLVRLDQGMDQLRARGEALQGELLAHSDQVRSVTQALLRAYQAKAAALREQVGQLEQLTKDLE